MLASSRFAATGTFVSATLPTAWPFGWLGLRAKRLHLALLGVSDSEVNGAHARPPKVITVKRFKPGGNYGRPSAHISSANFLMNISPHSLGNVQGSWGSWLCILFQRALRSLLSSISLLLPPCPCRSLCLHVQEQAVEDTRDRTHLLTSGPLMVPRAWTSKPLTP